MSQHGPIEEQHRELMNQVAKVLDITFQGYGWTLLVFDFHRQDGRMNYISNAQRADMLTAMKGFIAANEGRVMPEAKNQ
jgi:hypothetical protein